MGSRDHSITCGKCGYQCGGLNDEKCACVDPRPLVAGGFNAQAARAAVSAFDAGKISALALAGHLPGALDRVDELEEMCRSILLMTDTADVTGSLAILGIQTIRAILRTALRESNTSKEST